MLGGDHLGGNGIGRTGSPALPHSSGEVKFWAVIPSWWQRCNWEMGWVAKDACVCVFQNQGKDWEKHISQFMFSFPRTLVLPLIPKINTGNFISGWCLLFSSGLGGIAIYFTPGSPLFAGKLGELVSRGSAEMRIFSWMSHKAAYSRWARRSWVEACLSWKPLLASITTAGLSLLLKGDVTVSYDKLIEFYNNTGKLTAVNLERTLREC